MIMVKQTKAKAAALWRLKKYELRYRKILDGAAAVFVQKGYLREGVEAGALRDDLDCRLTTLAPTSASKIS